MNVKYIAVGVVAVMALGCTLKASEKREGFVASIGVGVALSNTDFDISPIGWSGTGSENHLGVASSFKIGYAFNDTWTLYLMRNSAFVAGYDLDPSKESYGNCITGVGVNYHWGLQGELYLMGAMGIGQLSRLKDSEEDAKRGGAFLVGLGYEIAPHVNLEATWLSTNVDDEVELKTNALQLTINYYWY